MKKNKTKKIKEKLKKVKNDLLAIDSNLLLGSLIILWGFVILWLLGITFEYVFSSFKGVLGFWLFVSQLFAIHKLLANGDR